MAGLHEVGTQRHDRAKSKRDAELTKASVYQAQRRRGVEVADQDAGDADPEKTRPGRQYQDQSDQDGDGVAGGGDDRHLAKADQPILQHA